MLCKNALPFGGDLCLHIEQYLFVALTREAKLLAFQHNVRAANPRVLAVHLKDLFCSVDIRYNIIGGRQTPTLFCMQHGRVLQIVIGIDQQHSDDHLTIEKFQVQLWLEGETSEHLC